MITPTKRLKVPTTYVIRIGNSDDKLSQEDWACFTADLRSLIHEWTGGIHFFGFSAPNEPWQNCCAVFNADVNELPLAEVQARLADLAQRFGQDSITLTMGTTFFVKAGQHG
jgi:hypothetical protein